MVGEKRWLGAGLLACAALVGCRAAPPAPGPPPALVAPAGLVVDVGAYAGTCLLGPVPGRGPADIESDPAFVFPLTVELWMTAATPSVFGAGLVPLSDVTDLVLIDGRRDPLRAAPRLFDGARLALGAEAHELRARLAAAPASEALLLLAGDDVVASGMTYRVHAALEETVDDPDNFLGEYPPRPPVEKAVEFLLECTPSGFAWLVALAGARPSEDSDLIGTPDEARFRPGSPRPVHERVAPRVRPAPGTRTMVLLPMPFESAMGRGLALYFELGEASAEGLEPERLGVALERVRKSARALERGLASAAPTDYIADTARETLAQLGELAASGVDPRPALVFLSGAFDASMARDLVLVLDRPALDKLVGSLLEGLAAGGEGVPFDARWCLESAAWAELGRAISAGDERPAAVRAAFRAIALVAAGQLGAFPSLIDDALRSSADTAAFEARLVDENLIFLEDSSPAARARAFAWLERRGLAPQGFDPLGVRAERQAALDAWAARTAEQQP